MNQLCPVVKHNSPCGGHYLTNRRHFFLVYTLIDHTNDLGFFFTIKWKNTSGIGFIFLQACSGDVPDNFPSQTGTSDTGLSIRDDLLESVLSESVIIGSAEVIPDIAVQPHTLQQEFALINVNIPNVIVEQVKHELSFK